MKPWLMWMWIIVLGTAVYACAQVRDPGTAVFVAMGLFVVGLLTGFGHADRAKED
jgi:hypothetical protein